MKAKVKLPTIKDIRSALITAKKYIDNDMFMDDDTIPSIEITLGANEDGEWAIQTGDNSYSGSAYLYPHWAVCTLYRRDNSTKMARELINQLSELMINY